LFNDYLFFRLFNHIVQCCVKCINIKFKLDELINVIRTEFMFSEL